MMSKVTGGDTTVLDLLLHHADRIPDRIAYRFLAAGDYESGSLTFADLAQRARRLAARLGAVEKPNTRVLLMLDAGLPFIEALFACMFARLVPVPIDLPKPNRSTERLETIVRHSGARALVTEGAELPRLQNLIKAVPDLGGLNRYLVEEGAAGAVDALPRPKPDEIAFIQYTSGSTRAPRGVVITHRNLISNQFQIRSAFEHDETTKFVGWLPMFHDMGLVGNVIHPLFLGIECTLMPPAAFIQRPLRWLAAISKYRATTSGGPNFAFDHCVDRIAENDVAALDLSSWRVAFCGAEPVRTPTLRAFARKFETAGFDVTSFLPCYGLAEATLFVSGRSRHRRSAPAILRVRRDSLEKGTIEPTDTADVANSVELVSNGPAAADQRIEIVDAATFQRCREGQVGEIWIAGPNVTEKCFNGSADTDMLVHSRLDGADTRHLRTGDLGALWDGELFVVGRIKNLIIVRGRKIHAEDVEQVASRSHGLFRPNRCAAFAIPTTGQVGDETFVIVQETARRPRTADELRTAVETARARVAAAVELVPGEIVLVRPGTIPVTSSGKIRHADVRAAYLDGRIRPFVPLETTSTASEMN